MYFYFGKNTDAPLLSYTFVSYARFCLATIGVMCFSVCVTSVAHTFYFGGNFMERDCGYTVKIIATILGVLGGIVSVVSGFLLFEYSVLAGVIVIVVGVLSAVANYWIIYTIGDIAEDTRANAQLLKKLNGRFEYLDSKPKSNTISSTYIIGYGSQINAKCDECEREALVRECKIKTNSGEIKKHLCTHCVTKYN